jgi:hypothetical protein
MTTSTTTAPGIPGTMETMRSFRFEVRFDRPVEEVVEAFWKLEDWPQVAPHVRGIDLHWQDETVQVLTMQVETRGRLDGFRSVRIRQDDSIFFFQPRPPALLRRHWGWWHVAAEGGGARVVSEHWIEPMPAEAERFLRSTGAEPAGDAEVERQLVGLIHHNSRQTMLALKHRLEAAATELTAEGTGAAAAGPREAS